MGRTEKQTQKEVRLNLQSAVIDCEMSAATTKLELESNLIVNLKLVDNSSTRLAKSQTTYETGSPCKAQKHEEEDGDFLFENIKSKKENKGTSMGALSIYKQFNMIKYIAMVCPCRL